VEAAATVMVTVMVPTMRTTASGEPVNRRRHNEKLLPSVVGHHYQSP